MFKVKTKDMKLHFDSGCIHLVDHSKALFVAPVESGRASTNVGTICLEFTPTGITYLVVH